MSKERNFSDLNSSEQAVEKDETTWTDAADKAQESLNHDQSVTKKDADDMNEHSAA